MRLVFSVLRVLSSGDGVKGRAVATSSPDADELFCAAKAYIGQYGSELVQDCIRIHDGIGVTYEHAREGRRAAAQALPIPPAIPSSICSTRAEPRRASARTWSSSRPSNTSLRTAFTWLGAASTTVS